MARSLRSGVHMGRTSSIVLAVAASQILACAAIRSARIARAEEHRRDVLRSNVPALVELMMEGDRDQKLYAVKVLEEVGPVAVPEILEVFRLAPEWLLEEGFYSPVVSKQGEDRFFDLLEDEQGGGYFAAVCALVLLADESLPELLAGLKHEHWSVRLMAGVILSAVDRSSTMAPELMEALDDESPAVRWIAEHDLWQAAPADPQAVTKLVATLDDADPAVRAYTLMALGSVGPAAAVAVPDIIDALDDGVPWVVRKAAAALGDIGPEARAAVPSLLALLGHEDQSIRYAASLSLFSIGSVEEADLPLLEKLVESDGDLERILASWIIVRSGAAGGKAEKIVEEAVPALVELLGSDVRAVRLHAIAALGGTGELGGEAALDLVLLLDDEDEAIATAAVPALVEMGQPAVPYVLRELEELHGDAHDRGLAVLQLIGPDVMPALVEALEAGDAFLKQEEALDAVAILGQDAHEGIPLLVQVLGSDSEAVRRFAIDALGLIGPPAHGAIPALAGMIEAGTGLEREILGALGRIGPEALPVLVDALGHGDHAVRCGALDAIGLIGPAADLAVPDVMSLLAREEDRVVAIAALGRIGPGARKAVPALLDLMSQGDDDLRMIVIHALGEIGTGARKAVPTLVEAIDDPDPDVREAALAAIGSIGPSAKGAVPALIDALATKDVGKRTLVIEALGRIGPPASKAIPALLALLGSRDEEETVACTLEKVKGETVLELESELGVELHVPDAMMELGEVCKPDAFDSHTAISLALGSMGKAAVPALVEALEHEEPFVRRQVLVALGVAGPEALAARGAIVEALGDEDVGVRAAAARTLGLLGPGALEALPFLLEALADTSPDVRAAASASIPLLEPEMGIVLPPLIDALWDGSSEVRLAAYEALLSVLARTSS